MSPEARPDAQRAEEVRSALARDAHELGITVSVSASTRCVVLHGSVATDERRSEVAAIARRMLPEFVIENRIAVATMAAPRREQLP